MKNIFKVLVCGLLVLCVTSCATMFPGNNEIAVSSSQEPVKVRVTNSAGEDEVFTTPFTYSPDRRRDAVFTVISDEYESEQYVVDKKMRVGMFLVDLLLTPFAAGLVVDFGSGMIFEHETKHLIIHTGDLVRKKAEAIEQGRNKFVARLDFTLVGEDKNKEPAEMKAHKKLKFHKVEVDNRV